MCGIVGFAGYSLDERAMLRAVNALRHRGPDGNGIYIDSQERVGLGHARLSIIDLETGAQPLYSENRDLVLVCNGEIYGFERLREELQDKGHVFSTRSDSEVILHLYEEHGLTFVDHLRGEFAFLLYDKANGVLLAVRDRFGIKPLFYNERNGGFLFASEAKAVFATGELQPRIDVVAIRDYLSGVIPESVFEGIRAVPPGCLLKVHVADGTHEIHRYWDLDLPPSNNIPETASFDDSMQTVGEAVEEAVRLRLRADVPVGVYLSGGIDSATVAALVAKHHTNQLKVFNIAFPDDATYDEFQLSRAMAEKIGAEFYSVSCDHESLLRNTEGCLWVSELPFPNLHGVGKFMLSRLAAKHVKVVLTGEGADEVFLGYIYFQPGKSSITGQMTNRPIVRKSPKGRTVRKIVETLGFLPVWEYAATFTPFQQRLLSRIFAPKQRPRLKDCHPLSLLTRLIDRKKTDGLPLVRQIQHYCIKSVLAHYILSTLGDRAEMAHSIEGRTPFLDHRLFEKARTIPDHHKIHDGIEKQVLREAFKDDLTPEIYQRKKWAYAAPPLRIRKGQSPELDRLIDTYLSKDAVKRSGLFNHRVITFLRLLARLVYFDGRTKQTVNTLLIFLLTVQILDRLYVQEFDAHLERHTN